MKITELEPFGKKIEVDLNFITDDEIKELLNLLVYNQNILIETPQLDVHQFNRVCTTFGISIPCETRCTHEEYSNIVRITNKEVNGNPGIFGVGELKWHYDGQFSEHPEDVIAMMPITIPYGYITSNANGKLAFDNLSNELKDICRNTTVHMESNKDKCILKTKVYDHMRKEDLEDLRQYSFRDKNKTTQEALSTLSVQRSLVRKHPISGEEGLFFPLYNTARLENNDLNDTELFELFHFLKDFHFQKEFVYNNVWKPNTILMLDQTMSIHCRPDVIGEREIYRLPFWYNL